jgi:hypothetical protein
MNVIYCGVNRRVGVSSKTGNAYDICEVVYLVPTKPKKTDAYDYTGSGHEPRTVPCKPEAMTQFVKVKLLEEVALTFEPKPDSPMRNWVSGVSVAKEKAA